MTTWYRCERGEIDELTKQDLLRAENGPKVLEVNSSPGLEGIENTTGTDVADLIYEFLESRVRPLSKNKDALRAT